MVFVFGQLLLLSLVCSLDNGGLFKSFLWDFFGRLEVLSHFSHRNIRSYIRENVEPPFLSFASDAGHFNFAATLNPYNTRDKVDFPPAHSQKSWPSRCQRRPEHGIYVILHTDKARPTTFKTARGRTDGIVHKGRSPLRGMSTTRMVPPSHFVQSS